MLDVKTFTFNPVEENTYVLITKTTTAALLTPAVIFRRKGTD